MPVTLSALLSRWELEPSVILGLVLLACGFAWLQRRPRYRVAAGRQASFYSAVAIVALALLSPLDVIGDGYLVFAHMVQHLLLVLLAAPLIARAIPTVWASKIRMSPVIAFTLFNTVFSLSHLEIWYQATLVHESLHILEHGLYIVTAILNWLPVVSAAEDRRLAPALQMLYLFAQTLPMFLVGSLLSLASEAIYPFYLRAPRIVPLTAVEDQSLAGLIMWIGGSVFYLGALTVVFFQWANREIGLNEPVDQPDAIQPRREDVWIESPRLSA